MSLVDLMAIPRRIARQVRRASLLHVPCALLLSALLLALPGSASAQATVESADLNDDGIVNILDLSLAFACVSNPGASPYCANADINGDGAVNNSDVFAIPAFFGQTTTATDTDPPTVTILNPADGTHTTASSIAISGIANDLNATVVINGTPATTFANTNFAHTVALAAGANVITVVATDAAGNVGNASITVFRDVDTCVAGNSCSTGQAGICAAGQTTCPSGPGGAAVCEAINAPITEICGDNLDNNCNGEVDDPALCVVTCNAGASCDTGVPGVCAVGNTTCPDGAFGAPVCQETVSPTAEICGDNLDNNCNGEVDDPALCVVTCNAGASCNTGLDGVCAAGETACPDGEFGAPVCEQTVTPTTEICGDNLDNDCNGEVDDPALCVVTCNAGASCNTGLDGVCAVGNTICPDGEFGAPVCEQTVTPTTEICGDNLDNDCNGEVDDPSICVVTCNAGASCDTGVPGVCAVGNTTCPDGEFGAPVCQETVTPTTEICGDNLDNNCNGEIDDPALCEVAAAPIAVSILTPANGALLADQNIATITGQLDDPAAQVTVNGIAATVDANATPPTFSAGPFHLHEGVNGITAVATNATTGGVGSTTIEVTIDTTPPQVSVETPSAGAVLTSLQVDVAGLINDIVTGTTINADDCQVEVNGVAAEVSNRSWVVPDLLLQRGPNTLTVVATDRAGNSRTIAIDVDVQDQAGQRVVLLSGNNQSGKQGSQLVDPLVVTLLDDKGDPVANQAVTFSVSRGNGLLNAFPLEGSEVMVTTDDNGLASVSFVMGERIGAGNHRVIATAPGFVGQVEFCAMATANEAVQIVALGGDRQTGIAEQSLPSPLVALVTDNGGNPVGGVDVEFKVMQGGGAFPGSPPIDTLVVTTDADGLASTGFILGPQEGINNNVATAGFAGLAGALATFAASGRVEGQVADTTISGVVLDNQDNAVPGATITLEVGGGVVLDPVPTAITDEQGRFTVFNAPVGAVHLIADASTTTREGRWPKLSFDLVTVAGQENIIGSPIWVLPLSEQAYVVQNGGPPEDIVLTLPDVAGASVTVKANSVQCAPGQSECIVSWTQVRSERVPMEPPMGSSFMLATTVQPPDGHFDPPARLCIPNSGMPKGTQVEMFSFDHDLGEFVAIGTATVSEDGEQICSDPGFGIVKGGWHGCVPPPPPPTCPASCDDGNLCTSDTCEDGVCVHTPNDGAVCDDGSGCGEGICEGGSCNLTPVMDDGTACDDGDACSLNETCQAGACVSMEQLDCDDGNECTDDTCEPTAGCENTNNQNTCDDMDGDKCTEGTCADGSCGGSEPKNCDDMNPCTIDDCDPDTGECTNEPDPAMVGMECGDPSDDQCSLMLCNDAGQCVTDTMMNEGMDCDDMNECTTMDKCVMGQCKGEDVDTSSFKDDASLRADIKIPANIVSSLNGAIQRIPGLSGVSFKEARAGVSGKVKDCCDEDSGVITNGIKEGSAVGTLTANIKGLPLWGPPTISRTIDFGVAEVSIDFEIGVRFDVDFRINGQIGKKVDQCAGEDCAFGEFNASLDPQFRVSFDLIACFDSFFTRKHCGGIEFTPAAIRFNFRVGASFNKPSCGDGLDFFATLGRVTFRSELKLGIPGAERFVFEFEIFGGF